MKIFLNGTFDILHTGHLKLINYAKSLGNYLYVSVDSDERVKEKKGHKRPINKLSDRIFLLENLKSVDKVLSFSTDFELTNIIKEIKDEESNKTTITSLQRDPLYKITAINFSVPDLQQQIEEGEKIIPGLKTFVNL